MSVNISVPKPLTQKQKQVLDHIIAYVNQHGYAPSLGEIADKLQLKAVSTVHKHITLLRKKGFLQKVASQPRGISPLEQKSGVTQVALLGRIAAGQPIDPIVNSVPINVPDFMIKYGNKYYALEVKGDSMIDDNVWDKDIILIKHQQTANEGDMIVASLEDGVTLKRFGGIRDGKVKLIPKNPTSPIMYRSAENFEIRGVFAGLIRRDNQF